MTVEFAETDRGVGWVSEARPIIARAVMGLASLTHPTPIFIR